MSGRSRAELQSPEPGWTRGRPRWLFLLLVRRRSVLRPEALSRTGSSRQSKTDIYFWGVSSHCFTDIHFSEGGVESHPTLQGLPLILSPLQTLTSTCCGHTGSLWALKS